MQLIIWLFCIGLVTKIFSIVDIGPYSITFELIGHFLIFSSLFFGYKKFPLASPGFLSIILLSFLGAFTATIWSNLDSSTATSILQMSFSVILFLFFSTFDRDKVRYLRICIGVVALVVVGYAIYQLIARPFGLPFGYLEITNQQYGSADGLQRTAAHGGSGSFEFLRVSSFFAEPGDLAKFLLIAMIVSYNRFSRGSYQLLTILIFGATIFASQSLGGIFILICILPFLVKAKNIASIILFGSFMILPIISLDNNFDVFVGRLNSILSGSAFTDSNRFKFLNEALEVIALKPFFGAGVGSSDIVFSNMIIANFWVNLLGEFGLIGSLIFALTYIYYVIRAFSLPENWLKIWLIVEFMALFWKPQLLYSSTIFVLFGLIHASSKFDKKNNLVARPKSSLMVAS